jgi:hypothetical protein
MRYYFRIAIQAELFGRLTEVYQIDLQFRMIITPASAGFDHDLLTSFFENICSCRKEKYFCN